MENRSLRTRIIGDGGHGRCIADLTGYETAGIKDEPVPDEQIIVGFGDPKQRKMVWRRYRDRKFPALNLSGIAYEAASSPGVQLMPGSIVMPSVKLGHNVLVNTGASVDHDCDIGNHCVISPGAIICGNVTLGECCFVGAGAVIVQGVKLDAETFVPAGALVVGQGDFRIPIRILHGIGNFTSTDGAAQPLG